MAQSDLKGGIETLKQWEEQYQLSFISSNIKDPKSKKPIFLPYKIVSLPLEKGEIKIAIAGITEPRIRRPATRPIQRPRATVPRQPAETTKPEKGSVDIRSIDKDRLLKGPTTPTPEPESRRQLTAPVEPSSPKKHDNNLPNKENRINPATEPNKSKTQPKGASGSEQFLQKQDIEKKSQPLPQIKPVSPTKDMDYEIADPFKTIESLIPQLKDKSDLVVLLANMRYSPVQRIAWELKGIDIIVSSYPLPGRRFKYNIRDTLLVHPETRGRYIGKITLNFGPDNKIAQSHFDKITIAGKLKQDPEISKILAEYKQETKKLKVERPKTKKIIYAGANNCQACHRAQYEQWKTTAHARAMDTLVKKNQQFNPDCITCHVTGYKRANGFWDYRTSRAFANVQCEVCHGPAYSHSLEQRVKLLRSSSSSPPQAQPTKLPPKVVPPAICLRCHDKEHDDDFNYQRDINLVSHQQKIPIDSQAEKK